MIRTTYLLIGKKLYLTIHIIRLKKKLAGAVSLGNDQANQWRGKNMYFGNR